ncbi:MAG: hypothetical protein F4139_10340 [Gemmatimonadetes bacterium]|nr:hypothetical protein [Gemmatimonadota bacterium]MYA64949.1 hypothetical protein [Gemmatimonadota bacterium]MYB98125.1 hypothetical protein [Gemmatimonadota bacterium]MYH53334.1 hypothetical protein [Gemmatimonadota bacterium]MYI45946.1 hypothetical protein [Gemmatimonadota bacterium]
MKRFQNLVLVVMVVGIAVQTWMAVSRTHSRSRDRSNLPKPLLVGDTLRALSGYSAPGDPSVISLDSDGASATVMYIFDPDCVHSVSLGSLWARHFDRVWEEDVGVRRIAVSLASPLSARKFAERHGWRLEVLSMAGLSSERKEYSLASKTPWVFVFDSDGVLRLHDHGSELDEVQAAVAQLLSESAAVMSGSLPSTTRWPFPIPLESE